MLGGLTSRATDQSLDRDTGVLALWGAGAVVLVATFASFLLRPGLVAVPLVAFLVLAAVGWVTRQAETVKGLALVATLFAVLVLALIIWFLFWRAYPVFAREGLSMFADWSAGRKPFGAARGFVMTPMIWGTAVTTVVATSIAAPLGVAAALFISEIAPDAVREVLKPAVEILAGIPSIVYGFIGFTIINPYFGAEWDTFVPPVLAVGLVIGLMALPTVVTVAEDAIASVPASMKDGAMAMGATDWQTIKSVTLPASISGVSAAIILGVGRAMGETMAATVMITHVTKIPDPWFDVFSGGETLTTLIAFNYGSSSGMDMRALFAAGVVLFVTVLALSVVSQVVEAHMTRKLEGEG